MRRALRTTLAMAWASALTALVTTGVVAGGWADVVMIDEDGAPPVAGEQHDVAFRLMQHGVTPVDFGRVELVATLADGGQQVRAQAVSIGNGEWVATITLPRDGVWEITVTHTDLLTSEPPPLLVGSAMGGIGNASATAGWWLPLVLGASGFIVVTLAGAALLVPRRPRRGERALEV